MLALTEISTLLKIRGLFIALEIPLGQHVYIHGFGSEFEQHNHFITAYSRHNIIISDCAVQIFTNRLQYEITEIMTRKYRSFS